MFMMSQAPGWVLGEKQRGSDMGLAPQGLIGTYELFLSLEEGLQGKEWSEQQEEIWQDSTFPPLEYDFLRLRFFCTSPSRVE